jgi:[ribosomal protein S5]-alanine N-acetyltransferase
MDSLSVIIEDKGAKKMSLIQSERLSIRHLTLEDSAFIFNLLNDSSWIKYIGDKGIKTEEDAKKYIQNGPVQMYTDYGFGLYVVSLKESGVPIGMCGLIKRPSLEDIDLGFAFLPEYTGKGYGFESASAVIQYEKERLSLNKIVAITTLDNTSSQNLLIKLGFAFETIIKESDEELKLFTLNLL